MPIVVAFFGALIVGGCFAATVVAWRSTRDLERELERWRDANARLASLYETAVARDNEARRALVVLTAQARPVMRLTSVNGERVEPSDLEQAVDLADEVLHAS